MDRIELPDADPVRQLRTLSNNAMQIALAEIVRSLISPRVHWLDIICPASPPQAEHLA
jgi:hypothetical protein